MGIDVTDISGIFEVLAGIALLVGVVLLVIGILMIVTMWKIFKKLGKPGWASIIPIYNIVVLLDHFNYPKWLAFLIFLPIVFMVIGVPLLGMLASLALVVLSNLLAIKISKVFNQSDEFTAGLLVLPIVFYPIIAFSKDAVASDNETLKENNNSNLISDEAISISEVAPIPTPVVENSFVEPTLAPSADIIPVAEATKTDTTSPTVEVTPTVDNNVVPNSVTAIGSGLIPASDLTPVSSDIESSAVPAAPSAIDSNIVEQTQLITPQPEINAPQDNNTSIVVDNTSLVSPEISSVSNEPVSEIQQNNSPDISNNTEVALENNIQEINTSNADNVQDDSQVLNASPNLIASEPAVSSEPAVEVVQNVEPVAEPVVLETPPINNEPVDPETISPEVEVSPEVNVLDSNDDITSTPEITSDVSEDTAISTISESISSPDNETKESKLSGEENTNLIRFCPNCGSQIIDNSEFCVNCGTKL